MKGIFTYFHAHLPVVEKVGLPKSPPAPQPLELCKSLKQLEFAYPSSKLEF